MQIRSRRRRHLSCFQAVGAFPGSFPANDNQLPNPVDGDHNIALSGATSERRMLSVPRPNQQHGGRKFSGLTCSQLKVEIANIGDNTSVRKNLCYRRKHIKNIIMWPLKKQYFMYVAVPEIELSDSVLLSVTAPTHSLSPSVVRGTTYYK